MPHSRARAIAGLPTLAVISAALMGPAAKAATETTILSFAGGVMGAPPYYGVIRDKAGNFYGAAQSGGPLYGGVVTNYGVVFKVSPAGKETVLHSFALAPDGNNPFGGLTTDVAGNLYGVTGEGGAGFPADGTIFEVSAAGKEKVLHSFGLSDPDGYDPETSLVADPQGNLYGTNSHGGTNGGGTVFRRSPTGVLKTLCSFRPATVGSEPVGRVAIDSAKNIYGVLQTSSFQNPNSEGAVFKVSPTGTVKLVYDFANSANGSIPVGGLIIDKASNLYGATQYGGNTTLNPGGNGVVFMITSKGKEQTLYKFKGGTDGANPQGSLVADAKGNLYGSTTGGGTGSGVIFKLTPTKSTTTPYSYAVLYKFKGTKDGGKPSGDLTLDSVGNLYGTTAAGGKGYGTLFKIVQ